MCRVYLHEFCKVVTSGVLELHTREGCTYMDFVGLLHPVATAKQNGIWCTYMDFVGLLHPRNVNFNNGNGVLTWIL